MHARIEGTRDKDTQEADDQMKLKKIYSSWGYGPGQMLPKTGRSVEELFWKPKAIINLQNLQKKSSKVHFREMSSKTYFQSIIPLLIICKRFKHVVSFKRILQPIKFLTFFRCNLALINSLLNVCQDKTISIDNLGVYLVKITLQKSYYYVFI